MSKQSTCRLTYVFVHLNFGLKNSAFSKFGTVLWEGLVTDYHAQLVLCTYLRKLENNECTPKNLVSSDRERARARAHTKFSTQDHDCKLHVRHLYSCTKFRIRYRTSTLKYLTYTVKHYLIACTKCRGEWLGTVIKLARRSQETQYLAKLNPYVSTRKSPDSFVQLYIVLE